MLTCSVLPNISSYCRSSLRRRSRVALASRRNLRRPWSCELDSQLSSMSLFSSCLLPNLRQHSQECKMVTCFRISPAGASTPTQANDAYRIFSYFHKIYKFFSYFREIYVFCLIDVFSPTVLTMTHKCIIFASRSFLNFNNRIRQN